MGIYGVEDDFWVDGYHFEVGFSNDNAVGHGPRDVTVGHRRKVEDLALGDFTGRQLLEAYTALIVEGASKPLPTRSNRYVPLTKRSGERHMRIAPACCATKREISSDLRKRWHKN